MLSKKERFWIKNLSQYVKKIPNTELKVERACVAWRGQKYRATKNGYCHIKNFKKFLAWYFTEYNKRKFWICPQVGRIDHSKGYSFNNICLQERLENVLERNSRYSKSVLVIREDSFVGLFESYSMAGFKLGIPKSHISACINQKGRRTSKGYSFYHGF